MTKQSIDEKCQELVDAALQPEVIFASIDAEHGDALEAICTMINPDYEKLLMGGSPIVESIEAQLHLHIGVAIGRRLR